MNQAHNLLPSQLQLGGMQVDEGAVAQARSRYLNDIVNPQLAQMRANFAAEGRDNSTFAGSAYATAAAEGDRQAYYVGEDSRDRAMKRWLDARQSYFGARGGEGGTVTSDKGGEGMASLLMGLLGNDTNRYRINQEYGLKNAERKNQTRYALANAGVGAVKQFGPPIFQGASNLAKWVTDRFAGHSSAPVAASGYAPGGYSALGAQNGPVRGSTPFGASSYANPYGEEDW